jgi:NAD(P) transhydrogenase subunit alpha
MGIELTLLAAAESPGFPLIALIFIFMLAIFVGFEIIVKIPPTLHTPLMSGSNAISGITLVGAVLAAGRGQDYLVIVLGTAAVALATINVVGGFLVTNRMLEMFRRKK